MRASAPNPFVRRFTQPGVILVAIVLAGAMGLVGGFQQIRAQIFGPFVAGNIPSTSFGAVATDSDTDGDGLPDERELQIYGTSPYIADSDSDGLPDGQEVTAGSDPLCAGSSCGALVQTAPPAGVGSAGTQLESTVDPASVTPEQLRQLLRDSGLSTEQVDSLTDEELAAAWQVALQQASSAQ